MELCLLREECALRTPLSLLLYALYHDVGFTDPLLATKGVKILLDQLEVLTKNNKLFVIKTPEGELQYLKYVVEAILKCASTYRTLFFDIKTPATETKVLSVPSNQDLIVSTMQYEWIVFKWIVAIIQGKYIDEYNIVASDWIEIIINFIDEDKQERFITLKKWIKKNEIKDKLHNKPELAKQLQIDMYKVLLNTLKDTKDINVLLHIIRRLQTKLLKIIEFLYIDSRSVVENTLTRTLFNIVENNQHPWYRIAITGVMKLTMDDYVFYLKRISNALESRIFYTIHGTQYIPPSHFRVCHGWRYNSENIPLPTTMNNSIIGALMQLIFPGVTGETARESVLYLEKYLKDIDIVINGFDATKYSKYPFEWNINVIEQHIIVDEFDNLLKTSLSPFTKLLDIAVKTIPEISPMIPPEIPPMIPPEIPLPKIPIRDLPKKRSPKVPRKKITKPPPEEKKITKVPRKKITKPPPEEKKITKPHPEEKKITKPPPSIVTGKPPQKKRVPTEEYKHKNQCRLNGILTEIDRRYDENTNKVMSMIKVRSIVSAMEDMSFESTNITEKYSDIAIKWTQALETKKPSTTAELLFPINKKIFENCTKIDGILPFWEVLTTNGTKKNPTPEAIAILYMFPELRTEIWRILTSFHKTIKRESVYQYLYQRNIFAILQEEGKQIEKYKNLLQEEIEQLSKYDKIPEIRLLCPWVVIFIDIMGVIYTHIQFSLKLLTEKSIDYIKMMEYKSRDKSKSRRRTDKYKYQNVVIQMQAQLIHDRYMSIVEKKHILPNDIFSGPHVNEEYAMKWANHKCLIKLITGISLRTLFTILHNYDNMECVKNLASFLKIDIKKRKTLSSRKIENEASYLVSKKAEKILTYSKKIDKIFRLEDVNNIEKIHTVVLKKILSKMFPGKICPIEESEPAVIATISSLPTLSEARASSSAVETPQYKLTMDMIRNFTLNIRYHNLIDEKELTIKTEYPGQFFSTLLRKYAKLKSAKSHGLTESELYAFYPLVRPNTSGIGIPNHMILDNAIHWFGLNRTAHIISECGTSGLCAITMLCLRLKDPSVFQMIAEQQHKDIVIKNIQKVETYKYFFGTPEDTFFIPVKFSALYKILNDIVNKSSLWKSYSDKIFNHADGVTYFYHNIEILYRIVSEIHRRFPHDNWNWYNSWTQGILSIEKVFGDFTRDSNFCHSAMIEEGAKVIVKVTEIDQPTLISYIDLYFSNIEIQNIPPAEPYITITTTSTGEGPMECYSDNEYKIVIDEDDIEVPSPSSAEFFPYNDFYNEIDRMDLFPSDLPQYDYLGTKHSEEITRKNTHKIYRLFVTMYSNILRELIKAFGPRTMAMHDIILYRNVIKRVNLAVINATKK